MDLGNLNNFLLTEANSNPLQNVTFLSNVFMMTFFTALGFQTINNIVDEREQEDEKIYRLEDDPMCGMTTGGREECSWDCLILRFGFNFVFNLDCLDDCYPPDHCLSSLLRDYNTAGGICRGGFFDVRYPGLYRVSNQPCEFFQDESNKVWDIKTGLCSSETEELLRDQKKCIRPLYTGEDSILDTVYRLILSMCRLDVWENFRPSNTRKYRKFINRNRKNRRKKKPNRRKLIDKVVPIEEVNDYGDGLILAQIPQFENTKHRYPWLCSLKSIGQQSSHFCAVTLLSRPPGPTVLVTSAHCTYICKSEEGNIVPNCCCPNVGPGLCNNNEECGTNAETVEMTGDDVEILCGEWDTATDTEEEYNVILPIEEITRHPNYTISRGEDNSQFVGNDIAVFKVQDQHFRRESEKHRIFPACLPTTQEEEEDFITGVHSGWSTPPPEDFINETVPLYFPYYKYFSRQWHYFMNVIPCKDPDTQWLSQLPLNYPTDSYYPPGTLCAREINGAFCPSSGESGSILMLKNNNSRLVASVYTKINCFLPWIARQYKMEFNQSDVMIDSDCITGSGDINEVTARACRTNPSNNNWDSGDAIEALCLFPFTLNGRRYNSCITDEIEGFTRPVFRCPIRTVKGAGTDYTDQHLIGGDDFLQGALCPTNSIGGSIKGIGQVEYVWNEDGPVYGSNGQLELDPDNKNCSIFTRPIFSNCKNTCRGVNFPVVSGGFALLAATAANLAGLGGATVGAAAGPVLYGGVVTGIMPMVAAGAVGILGVGAAMMCIGPAYCTTSGGQCCLLALDPDLGVLVCPLSCS